MSRFGYLRDPLCVLASALYALNRWAIKPHVRNAFFRFHFNDLLLIPCALPVVLLVQRRLGLRTHDAPPTAEEIVFHLVVWSVLFEVIGPHLMSRATGDVWDVAAYVAGGLLAWLWWHRHPLAPRRRISKGILNENKGT